MKDRLADALKKLQRAGADVDKVVARIRAGESRQKIGKEIGVHPRWLSDLNPLIERAEAAAEADPEAEVDIPEDDDRANMAAMRRMLNKKLPLSRRVNLWAKLAMSTDNANVSAKALERIDEITGIVPSKIPHEPDPPPLFALPENSMPALGRYEDWLARRGGDRGPRPPELTAHEPPPPVPPTPTRTGEGEGAIKGDGTGDGEGGHRPAVKKPVVH